MSGKNDPGPGSNRPRRRPRSRKGLLLGVSERPKNGTAVWSPEYGLNAEANRVSPGRGRFSSRIMGYFTGASSGVAFAGS